MEYFLKIGIGCFSLSTMILLILGMVNFVNVLAILLPSLLVFFGVGLSNPVFTSEGLKAHRHQAGVAGSLQGAIKIMMGFIFGYITSHLVAASVLPFGVVFGTTSCLIIVLYISVYRF